MAEDASDEDLYQAFIRLLADHGPAVEERRNVIRIEVDGGEPAEESAGVRGSDGQETVWVHITRKQLRSVAWEEFNIFDDRDIDVVPRTLTPVRQGLVAFAFYTEEELETMRPGEHHLVFHDGQLRASTSPTSPPVRSDRYW